MICHNEKIMNEVVNAFKQDKPKRKVWGNFRIEKDRLVYRKESKHFIYDGSGGFEKEYSYNTIARKVNGLILGNASILPLVGATHAWGYENRNSGVTKIQRIMETDSAFEFIPFNVFQEAQLNLSEFQVIEAGKPETITRKRINPRYSQWLMKDYKKRGKEYPEQEFFIEDVHFMGSRLFKCGDHFFLFDCDRNELQHQIFNPFLVKLPELPNNGTYTSVAQGYEALKPNTVVAAEKAGFDVKRQGEWFFIPTDWTPPENEPEETKDTLIRELINRSWGSQRKAIEQQLGSEEYKRIIDNAPTVPTTMQLRAGRNRPNNVEFGVTVGEVSYVRGMVTHSGREHHPMNLGDQWHLAIPNTATESFTITGDID